MTKHSFITLAFSTFNILGIDILPWHSDTTISKHVQLLTVKYLRHFRNFPCMDINDVHFMLYKYLLRSYSIDQLYMKHTKYYFQINIFWKHFKWKMVHILSIIWIFYAPGCRMVRIPRKTKLSGYLHIPLTHHFPPSAHKSSTWAES